MFRKDNDFHGKLNDTVFDLQNFYLYLRTVRAKVYSETTDDDVFSGFTWNERYLFHACYSVK